MPKILMNNNLIENPLSRDQSIIDPNHLPYDDRVRYLDLELGEIRYPSEILEEYARRHGVPRNQVQTRSNGLIYIDINN